MPLGVRDILLVVRAKDQASRTLTEITRGINAMNTVSMQTAPRLRAVGTGLIGIGIGVGAVGAAGVAMLGAMANAAMKFENEARRTLTQVDNVNISLKDVKRVAIDTARDIPAPFEQLQSSLYDIFSSMDVNLSGAEEILRAFSKGAVAGATDVQTAGRATIAILNGWGLGASQVNRIMDVQFQLVRKGVGDYEEFAKTIGRAIPSAVRAGQSVEELSGMLAFMTRNGLSAAMASTSAARAFDALSHPKTIARLEEMGIVVRDATGEFRPMSEIVRQLSERFKDMTAPQRAQALQELFKGAGGTIQARRFFDLALSNFNDLNNLIQDMSSSRVRGAMEEAYRIMFNSPQGQIQLLKNLIQTFAVTLGEQLLPITAKLIKIGTEFVQWLTDLSPQTQSNIVKFIALFSAVTLLIGGITALLGVMKLFQLMFYMTGVGFGHLVVSITALMVAVALVIEHWDTLKKVWQEWKGVIIGVVAVITTMLIPSLARIIALQVGVAIGHITWGLVALASQIARVLPFIMSLRGALTLWAGVAVVMFINSVVTAMDKANTAAKKLSDQIRSGFDTRTRQGLLDYRNALGDTIESIEATGKVQGGWNNAIKQAAQLIFTNKSEIEELRKKHKELSADAEGAVKALRNLDENLYELSKRTGMTTEQVDELAKSLGVDLTQGWEQSADARAQILAHWQEITNKTKLSSEAMVQWAGVSEEAQEEAAKALEKYVEQVDSSFKAATDVVAAFSKETDVTAQKITDWYKHHVGGATKFAQDVSTAINRGYDPALIARILAAGPEQAAPLLHAITTQHSEKLKNMVNESEKALTRINTLVVEQARITHLATTSVTDKMSADVGTALRIVQAQFAAGGKLSAEALAKELKIGVDDVRRVVGSYGITIAQGINPVIVATGGRPIPIGNLGGSVGPGRPVAQADGGILQFFKSGGFERHVAQIAPAGSWRVWAEPETGGEAYIPLSPAKRERSVDILKAVANRFGFSLAEYANGFITDADIPKVPRFPLHPVGEGGRGSSQRMYDTAAAYMRKYGMLPAGGGYQSIIEFMRRSGVPFTVTSTLRPGSITGSGNLSLHAVGKAVDMVGPNMQRIFDTLMRVSHQLAELFYTPAGFSIKNGRRTGLIAAADHYDHVHAATFDNGGTLLPGWNRVYNGTGRPEHVSPDPTIVIENIIINESKDPEWTRQMVQQELQEVVRTARQRR